MSMSTERWWNDTDGKTVVLRKGCLIATLSTTDYIWNGVELNR